MCPRRLHNLCGDRAQGNRNLSRSIWKGSLTLSLPARSTTTLHWYRPHPDTLVRGTSMTIVLPLKLAENSVSSHTSSRQVSTDPVKCVCSSMQYPDAMRSTLSRFRRSQTAITANSKFHNRSPNVTWI
jgi:hypothetical protein